MGFRSLRFLSVSTLLISVRTVGGWWILEIFEKRKKRSFGCFLCTALRCMKNY